MLSLNLLPPAYLVALFVDDVLESYPLPGRRAETIRRLARKRFSEQPDLSRIHLFIDALVENGLRPETFFSSLDAGAPHEAPSPPPPVAAERRERGRTLTFDEIASRLETDGDQAGARTLTDLVRRANLQQDAASPLHEKDLPTRLPAIRERLAAIRERLDRCGVLALPRRVGRVSFRSKELFEYRGRYPGKVSDLQAQRMFEAHRLGMSQTRAAAHAAVSRDTVRRWWKDAGLSPPTRPHNALDPALAARVLDAHRTTGGCASRASRETGVSRSTVIRLWNAAGLSPSSRSVPLTAETKRAVREAHAAFDGNATRAASSLGLAPSTVRKHWKRSGLKPGSPGRPSSGAGP